MRIGILADIHEAAEPLERALIALREQGADRYVVLGDILETGENIEKTVDLLSAVGAVGVWGNHDFGLCRDPVPELQQLVGEKVVAFFATPRSMERLDSGVSPGVSASSAPVAGCEFDLPSVGGPSRHRAPRNARFDRVRPIGSSDPPRERAHPAIDGPRDPLRRGS